MFYFTPKEHKIGKGSFEMHEKELQFGLLLDFYGELISEKRRMVIDMYFNNDYSLSEIAEQIGITRQGVLDSIKKGKDELSFFEEKLGLAKRFEENEKNARQIRDIISSEQEFPQKKAEMINSLLLKITG